MSSLRRLLTCVSLIAAAVSGEDTIGAQANQHWVCTGCGGERLQAIDVFGAIRQAVHREERTAFVAIDMSWLDDLLLPSASVRVLVVEAKNLANTVLPSLEPNSGFTYRVVVSEAPEGINVEHRHYHRRRSQHYLDPPPESALIFDGTTVDAFLTHNPCWLPLSEPIRATHGRLSSVGSRRRLSASPSSKPLRLLVLVEMPNKPLQTTCLLFKYITQKQFPTTCSYDKSSMALHELSNIGFAHTVIHLTHSFINNLLAHGRINILPRADPYYSRQFMVTDPRTGVKGLSNSGWSWADPLSCAPDTYLHDPWACNFLSVSNCSDRFKSAHLTPEPLTAWFTPSAPLRALGITDDARKAAGDSPEMNEEQWAQSRAYAFMQRPNAYLRLLIRTSLRNVAALISSSSSAAPSADFASFSSSSSSLGAFMSPCLTMHVRHSDLFLEQHRVAFGIDRSFDAHVQQARNLTRPLGLHKIFLATDNATIYEVAQQLYPEFTWLLQRRPVRRHTVMFGQFTEQYTTAAQNFSLQDRSGQAVIVGVGRVGGGNREKQQQQQQQQDEAVSESPSATLSHILADWRAASYCSAMIGAFDSGLAAEMMRTMCGLGRGRGRCPPSIDLRCTKQQPGK